MNKSERIATLVKQDPTLSSTFVAETVGCTERLVRKVKQDLGTPGITMPKILLFDIETAPLEVYVWHLYKNVVTPGMMIKDRSILSWSAKWLFEDNIMGQVVTPKEAFNREDNSIMHKLWELLNAADIVIAHNGIEFDVKISNARFALNEMVPPMPYRVIDTLRAAKRVFSVPSFKLEDLNQYFGLELKMEHEGMGLWKRCVNQDKAALQTMLKYNKRDVAILEELYLKIRPWIKSHPNLGLYIDTEDTVCTNCGNKNLTLGGNYFTPAGKYRSFRCDSCGAIGRSRISDLDKEEKARLLLSISS